MKRFDSLKSLVDYLGGTSYTLRYLENEVTNFEECVGSDIVDNEYQEPSYGGIEIEVENKKYMLYVSSIEVDIEEYKSFYWIEEI